VHRAAYTTAFDTSIRLSEVKHPEEERPIDRRQPSEKSIFPRMHPKHLPKGDSMQSRNGGTVTEDTF